MSLWWARKEQLDKHQIGLIEGLPLNENHLVLGPPGSGKTNVLLRRAQFVRSQELSNVLVLTFTRPLTEFVKTGCTDDAGREIFPRNCVSTLEAWMRWLHVQHEVELPPSQSNLKQWKAALALSASGLVTQGRVPLYDTLFVDEVQDLLHEEVELISRWGKRLFVVGDDRQKIYGPVSGLPFVRKVITPSESVLPFHYRVAPELCRVADRILKPQGGDTFESACHYDGPKPGRIEIVGPLSRDEQLLRCVAKLRDQIRVYADLIKQGDRIGIIVAKTEARDSVYDYLERDPDLRGKSKIIRARTNDEDGDYTPTFDDDVPICILTVAGCKGLEFRAVHWLFCEELCHHHTAEHYYTVVTRAKTSLDISYNGTLPQELARSYSAPGKPVW